MNTITILIITIVSIILLIAILKMLDFVFYKQLYLFYFFQTPSSPIEILGRYNVKPQDKKIISLSLFGKKQYYFDHVRAMCEDIKIYFPGWKIRIYIHYLVHPDIIQEFIQKDCQVFIVKQENVTPSDSTFWRFLAAEDDIIFISRDVDYKLNKQDYELTEKWIKDGSTKFIKYMPLSKKDKYVLGYTNSKYLIRNFWAGFWGGRDRCVPDMLDRINDFKFKKHWHSDELFLETVIWKKYVPTKGIKLIMDSKYKSLEKRINKKTDDFVKLEYIDLKLTNSLISMKGKEAVKKFIEFYENKNQRTL